MLLRPGPDTVDIWPIKLDLPTAVWSALVDVLDDRERDRTARSAMPIRGRFVVARAAARTVLGGYLGIDARQVQWGYHGHGKPVVAGLRHHASHSADHALLAVPPDRAVGVDIEAGPLSLAPCQLADRFFPPAEALTVRRAPPDEQRQRYLRLWTRKEACVKAAAGQLRHGLQLAVAPQQDPSRTDTVVRCRTGALRGCWWISDLPVAAPLVAAVAVAGPRPCRIRIRRWDAPWSVGTAPHGSKSRLPARPVRLAGLRGGVEAAR